MRKIAAIAACALCAGCGLFWDDPYIEVKENPLNWIEVHYYNVSREPIRRTSVRVTGGGDVQTKSGTTTLVTDDFSKQAWDGESTRGFRRNHYQVPADHVRELFQELVNAGLFDKDKTGTSTKYPSEGRCIAFSVAIDNKTLTCRDNVFETDPELAERLYNMVLEFNRPHLGKTPFVRPSTGSAR